MGPGTGIERGRAGWREARPRVAPRRSSTAGTLPGRAAGGYGQNKNDMNLLGCVVCRFGHVRPRVDSGLGGGGRRAGPEFRVPAPPGPPGPPLARQSANRRSLTRLFSKQPTSGPAGAATKQVYTINNALQLCLQNKSRYVFQLIYCYQFCDAKTTGKSLFCSQLSPHFFKARCLKREKVETQLSL